MVICPCRYLGCLCKFIKPEILKKRFLRSQILNIFTIHYTVTEVTSFTKNYLERFKTVRNGSKFTIGKYRINTIAKLFPIKSVYSYIKHSLIVHVVILQKEARSDIWSIQRVIQRNQ